MALTATKYNSTLKMILNLGVDPDTQKTVTKTKSFTGIKEDATDEGMYNAAKAIAGLQKHAVTSIRKQETYELMEE